MKLHYDSLVEVDLCAFLQAYTVGGTYHWAVLVPIGNWTADGTNVSFATNVTSRLLR